MTSCCLTKEGISAEVFVSTSYCKKLHASIFSSPQYIIIEFFAAKDDVFSMLLFLIIDEFYPFRIG